MKKLILVIAILLCSSNVNGMIISGIGQSEFATATVETFTGNYVVVDSYDFGNGMQLSSSDTHHVNYTGTYGLGDEPGVSGGIDGTGTGFFGTVPAPATFRFNFTSGINKFGFYGAEAVWPEAVWPANPHHDHGNNGELDINFYDSTDSIIDSLSITTLGTFAWDQWHGFMSTVAIHSVEFYGIGHSVFDNVSFVESQAVPEPSTYILLGIGLIGITVISIIKKRSLTSST